MTTERIKLTDEQWMSIIVAERDGLPRCCANVSALRDHLIGIAREDGTTFFAGWDKLHMYLGWVYPAHEMSDAMARLCAQVDYVAPSGNNHEKQYRETHE